MLIQYAEDLEFVHSKMFQVEKNMLAKAVIFVPHGNADVERMFSHIGLNKTKLRSQLSTETLSALLCLQFNMEENCYNFNL